MMEEDMNIPKVRESFYTIYVKRFLDVILSGLSLFVLSPVLLITALLVRIKLGSPILFKQARPGLNGKIFYIYKFRSMTNEVDENGELLPDECRVTKFGLMLRKFSIDELPELLCIFTGKMSIIGPRPLRTDYLPLYNKRHSCRHMIRPGLACVRLKPGNTWTWREQFENDIFYIENVSFWLDVKMIFAVLRETIHPREYRTNPTRPVFNGDNLDE